MSDRARNQKKKLENPAFDLIEALKFLKPLQTKKGEVAQQHVMLFNKWAVSCDQQITLGAKIHEDLEANPNYEILLSALGRVSGDLSITKLENNLLSIKSGDFSAIVPCTTPFNLIPPCDPAGPIDNSVRDALVVATSMSDSAGLKPIFGHVLLEAKKAVGVMAAGLIECKHNSDLPPGMLIPKKAAIVLSKIKKNFTSVGYSGNKVTFWFDDNSFMAILLNKELQFPEYQNTLTPEEAVFVDIPDDFFKAISHVKPFSENNIIYFNGDCIHSGSEMKGVYQIIGVPYTGLFDANYLLKFRKGFKKYAFDDSKVYFQGDDCNGVLGSYRVKSENE